MVLFTYLLGLPICAIAVLGKYSFLKSNYIEPDRTETNIENKIEIETILSIVPDVGENLNIKKNAFLYAQSEGNYSKIFYLNGKIIEKELLRISLKNLEVQIGDDIIIRCHRSYIVNIQNAIHKKGNAQGLKISLKLTDEKIPVSRKYIDKINSMSIKILQSMSRKANCWNNAVAESFFKTLKADMVYQRKFMDQQSAKLEVFWIY